MAQPKGSQNHTLNSFAGMVGIPSMMQNPMMILAEMNGSFLKSVATAQKDWMDFLHRRIKEDVAMSRELMRCQSLPEMHQVCSQYFQTAFEQVVQRGENMAQHLTETAEAAAKEGTRATLIAPQASVS